MGTTGAADAPTRWLSCAPGTVLPGLPCPTCISSPRPPLRGLGISQHDLLRMVPYLTRQVPPKGQEAEVAGPLTDCAWDQYTITSAGLYQSYPSGVHSGSKGVEKEAPSVAARSHRRRAHGMGKAMAVFGKQNLQVNA